MPCQRPLLFLTLLYLCSCKNTMILMYANKFDKFNGKDFPKIPLTDINGKTVPFDTLKGKVIYMDTWYVGCGLWR